jgi:hypothetical protein
MTETNCDLFTHKSSRSYLNHLVYTYIYIYIYIYWSSEKFDVTMYAYVRKRPGKLSADASLTQNNFPEAFFTHFKSIWLIYTIFLSIRFLCKFHNKILVY